MVGDKIVLPPCVGLRSLGLLVEPSEIHVRRWSSRLLREDEELWIFLLKPERPFCPIC